jgi:dienelactone hydrolase
MQSQTNTEAVLDWILSNPAFAIDTTRIYGIGFSMGGGSVTNFAARHLDPARPMLAAIIDHSGGVALNNTYYNDPAARFILDFWYGNGSAGSADPWAMARSSVIDFDPLTFAVDPSSDLASNLVHIPLQIWRASTDPIFYVQTQCDVLASHLENQLGLQVGPEYSYTVVPYTGHDWNMIDQAAACDWLAQFTLEIPTSGETLADHDGVYFHFYIEQDAPNAFTPFAWSIDTATNTLEIDQTHNLLRATVDLASTGLDPTQQLNVELGTLDGLPDEVKLVGVPAQPASMLRDGIPAVAGASWTYNAQTQELSIQESDGAPHSWTAVP